MGQIGIKLDTTFSERTAAGKVVKMHKKEKTEREAVKIALGIVFEALALAREGATLEEVKKAIQKNKGQFEIFQSLAMSEVEVNLASKKDFKEARIDRENEIDCNYQGFSEADSGISLLGKDILEIANENVSNASNLLQLDDEEL